MPEVVSEQFAAGGAEGLLDRRDLCDDVGAVAFRFDHPLQSTHLPLDPAKPGEHGGLDLGVYRDGTTSFNRARGTTTGEM